MTEQFKVGDLVKWKSQANASRLLKVGMVVGVISPGCRVFLGLLDFSGISWMSRSMSRHHRNFNLTSLSDDVTYVVSVKTGVTHKAKRTLYHPRQEVILAGPEDEEGVWGWNQSEGKWNAG